MSSKRVVAQFPFCAKDARYEGAVEVMELEKRGDNKTIGIQLRVRSRTVSLPRNRVPEVIAALQQAQDEASEQYRKIIEEMNHE